jgi:hypothetical protein
MKPVRESRKLNLLWTGLSILKYTNLHPTFLSEEIFLLKLGFWCRLFQLRFQVLISPTQLLLSVFSRPRPLFHLYTDLCDLFGLHVSEEKNLDEIALLPLLTDVFEHDIYGNLLFTAIFMLTSTASTLNFLKLRGEDEPVRRLVTSRAILPCSAYFFLPDKYMRLTN